MAKKPKWVVSVENENDSERDFTRVFGSEEKAYKFAADLVSEVVQELVDDFTSSIEHAPEEETPGEHSKASLRRAVEYLKEIIEDAKGPDVKHWTDAIYEYGLEEYGPYDWRISVERAY